MAERNRPGDAGDPADDEVRDDAVIDDATDEADDEPVSRGGGVAVRERTKDAESPKAKNETQRRGFFGRIGGFFREVVSELRKVIWPTRKELLTYTTIVIIFVVVMTTIVGLLDLGFGRLILWAFGS